MNAIATIPALALTETHEVEIDHSIRTGDFFHPDHNKVFFHHSARSEFALNSKHTPAGVLKVKYYLLSDHVRNIMERGQLSELKCKEFPSRSIALEVLMHLILGNHLEKKKDGVPPASYLLLCDKMHISVHMSGYGFWYVCAASDLEYCGDHNIVISLN